MFSGPFTSNEHPGPSSLPRLHVGRQETVAEVVSSSTPDSPSYDISESCRRPGVFVRYLQSMLIMTSKSPFLFREKRKDHHLGIATVEPRRTSVPTLTLLFQSHPFSTTVCLSLVTLSGLTCLHRQRQFGQEDVGTSQTRIVVVVIVMDCR